MLTAAWIFYGAIVTVRMAITTPYPLSIIEIVVWVVIASVLSVWAIIEDQKRKQREKAADAAILELTKSSEYNKGMLNTLGLFGSKTLEAVLDERPRESTGVREKQQLLASLDKVLHEVLVGKSSSLSTFGKLAYLQRREAGLQEELSRAEPEEKRAIIERLVKTLEQQLQRGAFQAPSQRAQDQQDEIVRKIKV